MRIRALLFTALASLASACIVPDPDPGFTPAWEPFDPTEEGWETTRKVLLVADCQLHNLYSQPVPDRNRSAKAAIATAIRAPQLDLFSEDVLSWILRNGSPDAEAILHLGDALDMACEGEWERFERVMGESGKPWFMAPGNHDTFYFGNYHPQNPQRWDEACYRSGRRLTKDLFIRLYLGSLLRQEGPGIDAFAGNLGLEAAREESSASLGERLPLEYEWSAPLDTPGFLKAVAWRIDVERPWRSYLIQSIDLTPEGSEALEGRALLLDSCQYARRPEMVPNGWKSYPLSLNSGLTGEMLPDQLRVIRSWLERDESIGHSLICHHPFAALSPRAKSSLGYLWREHRVAALITAHTHDGYYEHHDLGGGVERLELNIGSTTDWPMEWRTFVAYHNQDRTEGYLRSERQTLVDAVSHQDGFFLPGWEVPLGAPDDYRNYKQGEGSAGMFFNYYFVFHVVPYWLPQPKLWVGEGARKTEEAVKDTLLLTYRRLITLFPTDRDAADLDWPEGCFSDVEVVERIESILDLEGAFFDKVALLVELDRWEHARPTRDPVTGDSLDETRMRYKVSQAAWASRYESAKGRRLRVEDELIRVTRKLMADPMDP